MHIVQVVKLIELKGDVMTLENTPTHTRARPEHAFVDERMQSDREYLEALEIEDLRRRVNAVTEARVGVPLPVRAVVILAALTLSFLVLTGRNGGLGTDGRSETFPQSPLAYEQVGREGP